MTPENSESQSLNLLTLSETGFLRKPSVSANLNTNLIQQSISQLGCAGIDGHDLFLLEENWVLTNNGSNELPSGFSVSLAKPNCGSRVWTFANADNLLKESHP